MENYPKSSFSLSVCAFQIRSVFGQVGANRDKIINCFKRSDADLSLFPEACSSGFDYPGLDNIAAANQDFLQECQELARQLGRGLILPLLVREEGKFYNRQFCIGPRGQILGTYDKLYLIGALQEDQFLSPGERPVVFDYPLPTTHRSLRLGTATCYDLRFPELFRTLALEMEADLFLLPAMWPRERIGHFQILLRARALENQLPLVACNGVDTCGGMNLGGRSAAIDHKGDVLFEAPGVGEADIRFRLDQAAVLKWRKDFPVLADARGWTKPGNV